MIFGFKIRTPSDRNDNPSTISGRNMAAIRVMKCFAAI
jgi:hypothetical protein